MNSLVGKSTGIALLMAAALIAALFAMGVFSATGVNAGVVGTPKPTAELSSIVPAATDVTLTVTFQTDDTVNGSPADDQVIIDIDEDITATPITAAMVTVTQDGNNVGNVTIGVGGDTDGDIVIGQPTSGLEADLLKEGVTTTVVVTGLTLDADATTEAEGVTITQSAVFQNVELAIYNVANALTGLSAALSDDVIKATGVTLTLKFTTAAGQTDSVVITMPSTYDVVGVSGITTTVAAGTVAAAEDLTTTSTSAAGDTIIISSIAAATAYTVTVGTIRADATETPTAGFTNPATKGTHTVSIRQGTVLPAQTTTFDVNDVTPPTIGLSSKVAGAPAQVVVEPTAGSEITSANDIVVDLKKFGVPSTIPEGSVVITSSGGMGAYVGEPSSVTVGGTKVTLALYSRFPGTTDSTINLSVNGKYKITFKQSAGITNPIVAGKATVSVKDVDGTESFTENIQSQVKLSKGSGPRGTETTVSVVGLGAGGATVYLVQDCPDQQVTDGKKDCEEENDISLGNAESSGGKISIDIETSSSDFEAGVDQVDDKGMPASGPPYKTTDSLRGLNRIAVVDGTGRTTDKDAYFQITPTIEVDEESGKQGDEMTILVEDWYFGTVFDVRVGDEPAIIDDDTIGSDGDGEIDIFVPNTARLGEQQLKVIGSFEYEEGSLTTPARDTAKGSILVDALDIELDPATVVLGQQFTVKVKGFSDTRIPLMLAGTARNEALDPDIQYVKVGDITLEDTTVWRQNRRFDDRHQWRFHQYLCCEIHLQRHKTTTWQRKFWNPVPTGSRSRTGPAASP